MDGVTFEQSVELLMENAQEILDLEEISLINSVGRVIPEDYFAIFDNSPFDRRPLDGFALKSEDTNAPRSLKVIGEECAGDELINLGEKLTSGKIYNSNLFLIASRLIEMGFELKILGILSDNAENCSKILSELEIDDFKARGAQIDAGSFGENIISEGFTFKKLPIGTRLQCGNVFFEITQIGKECHIHCAIYRQIGDCIMPREGIFARRRHKNWR